MIGPQGERAVPRLNLAHYAIWITVTSILLGIHRGDLTSLGGLQSTPFETTSFVAGALNLAATPLQAIAITALAEAITRGLNRSWSFPSHPGHWLLVAAGAYEVAHETLDFVWLAVIVPSWEGTDFGLQDMVDRRVAMHVIFHGWTALILFAGAWSLRRVYGWCVVLVSAAMGTVVLLGRLTVLFNASSETLWLERVGHGFFAAASLACIAAMIIDLQSRPARDGFHWLGVLVSFVLLFRGLFGRSIIYWLYLP
jgi:hypothetical protein